MLNAVPEDRRDLLVATETGNGYRFDITIQAEQGETPFFAL